MNMTELGLDHDDIAFPGLGIDKITIDNVAFSIGKIDIAWYGVIIACGMILAIVFGMSNMRKVGLDPNRAIDAIIGGVIGGVAGARLYYVAMNWEEYSKDLKSIFNTRNGGLAIYGGVIGALLVGLIIAKMRKVKLLPLLDLTGMGFLIGQGIGRWGNFVNQEAFGCNTDLPWGMTGGRIQSWIVANYSSISSPASVIELDPDLPVHPCFLYESLWCLIGFVILFTVFRKRKFDGQIFLLYIFWYGLGRFFIEGLRTDSLMIGNLRVSQVLAAVSSAVAFILLIIVSSKVKRMGDDYVLYKDTEESKHLLEEADKLIAEEKEKKASKKKGEQKSEDKEAPAASSDEKAGTSDPESSDEKNIEADDEK